MRILWLPHCVLVQRRRTQHQGIPQPYPHSCGPGRYEVSGLRSQLVFLLRRTANVATGAGKSSMINALLGGEVALFPSPHTLANSCYCHADFVVPTSGMAGMPAIP